MRSWPITNERRTLIGIIALAALVAVTGWRRFAATSPTPVRLPPEAAREADYSLSNFRLTLLDDQGKPAMQLKGSAMRHDPALSRSNVQEPRARILQDPGVEWDARANTGWVTDDGTQVQLEQAVQLDRGGSAPDLTLKTDSIMLFPKRRLAQTDAAVLLEQPGATLTGRGFSADLAGGHYRLNAQVKGNYDIAD